ncbi:MAG TPA: cytochrome c maturation protein CcmE [Nannocystaceae bacterium]|nr:cytochrome c maturation protein CcmE [Nannocystaceae bacterium]
MRSAAIAIAVVLLGCSGKDPPSEGGDGDAARLAYELLARKASVGPLEYVEVDALAASQRGRRVKVHGFVEDAPIERTPDGARHRFTMAQRGAKLVVEHQGMLPDRFQPKLELIVTGTLSDDGTHIASDELVAKCPETYEDGSKPR